MTNARPVFSKKNRSNTCAAHCIRNTIFSITSYPSILIA